MNITFDTLTGELTIDTSTIQPYGADIQALLNRHGNVINLQGVEMSLTIHANGEQVFFTQLPPPGVRYEKTDQDLLATGQARWLPDQTITAHAWCKTSTGHEVTANAIFVAPRPPQPYPSWTWMDTQWTAPVPYPDSEGDFVWNEQSTEWVTPEPVE
jgi:hypothetical protein